MWLETPASASGQLNDDGGDGTLIVRKNVSHQLHHPRRNEFWLDEIQCSTSRCMHPQSIFRSENHTRTKSGVDGYTGCPPTGNTVRAPQRTHHRTSRPRNKNYTNKCWRSDMVLSWASTHTRGSPEEEEERCGCPTATARKRRGSNMIRVTLADSFPSL